MTWVGVKQVGDGGIADDPADLGAHELGGDLVGVRLGQRVGEHGDEAEPALLPTLVEEAVAVPGVDLGHGVLGRTESRQRAEPGHRLAVGGSDLGVAGLDLGLAVPRQRLVVGGHAVGGGALEHGEVGRLLGDDGDRLHGRRPGPDDGHAPAGEVDALVGPPARVVGRAPERVTPRDVGQVGRRQAAGGGDHEAGREPLAGLGPHRPGGGLLVEGGADDPRVALDVPP